MNGKCIAIIPARGGSKRIKGKNIRDFFGKPIISYTIEALRNSGLFEDIYVTTDCENIKKVAESNGAIVPFLRAKDLSDDITPTIPVLSDAIKRLKGLNIEFDNVCWMYAIAPLVTPNDLREAYNIFKELDSYNAYVAACTEFNFPIQRGFYYEEQKIEMVNPEHLWSRSQDLKKTYHEAGTFWFGSNKAILDHIPVLNPHTKAYFVPHWRVQDIDYEEDWQRVEIIYELMQKRDLI